MTKNLKRFFSMLLAMSMVFSLVLPAAATETEEHDHAAHVEETTQEANQAEPINLEAVLENITVNTEEMEFETSFDNYLVLVDPDTEIDREDPAVLAFETELKEIKVLNAEGDPVPLTTEQIQEVLGMYQQYLDHWDAHMDVLGLQTPFFLSFNDNGDDGLGALGEMLALAGVPVAAVRGGYMSYDDLTGMILNFMLGDQLGVQLYGTQIEMARDEVLALVEASGAQTEAQKLLVINDWLAHKNTFDMPYIMNSGKENPPMVAENPVKPENYDIVYGAVMDIYKPQITKTFEDNIRNGLEAEFKRQYYTGAIQNVYYQGGIAKAYENEELIAAVKQGIYDQALLQGKQKVYDDAFNAMVHEHNAVVTFTWAEDNTATAAVVCEGCTDTLKCGDVTVTPETVAATCDEAGKTTYTATVKVTNVANEEVAYTVANESNIKEVNVEALGHDYDETTGECKREGCDAVKPAETELTAETDVQEVLVEENETEEVLTEETETEEALTEENETEEEQTEEAASSASAIPEEITFEAEDENVTVAAEGDPEYMQGVTTREAENAEAHAAAVQVVGENLSALEAAAQDASNDEATLNAALKQTIEGDPDDNNDTAVEQQINAEANEFIEANAEALATDPAGFIDSQEMFLQEVPVTDAEGNYVIGEDGNPVMMPLNQQLHMGWDAFWEDAKTNGVEMDPVNAPGVKMTVDQIVEMQMDQPQKDDMLMKLDADGNPILDENGNPTYMTPNEAVPIFAGQAAEGLTGGIINYWEGSHFGALGFTTPTSVCLGYAKAFTYLVQCMHPEIYGISDDADMSDPANWKLRKDVYTYNEDGTININEGYVVDNVRVTFAAEVTMYGQKEDNFNADHFWNAVKVDGKWYYIDPCYTDVFTEVMMRDRVETDGQMNHLYFLFSHDSCVDLYEGNYEVIKTLYENAANHKDYEDAWFARIASNTYFDGGYAYYLYDSTDMLTMMTDFENQNQMNEVEEATYKVVRHHLTGNDLGNGDTDYEDLIVFNHKADENADPVAKVLDPATGALVDNELLTELYEKHEAYVATFPSVNITAALHGGKIYFNLANCILSYDLETGAIATVKEYNTVKAHRDTTKAFGGMAFEVAADGSYTVENHPIAGMTIKNGTMVVSIATNFAFISGKADRCDPASAGFGYAYEESNYNDDYNTYLDLSGYDDAQLEQFGYVKEVNDNDEFMWTANFVEKLSMGHLDGSGHSYASVSVDATCGIDAYTENRCTTCGAIEAGTRVYQEGTAGEHHYIKFHETFYTKNSNGVWNDGDCYVCTVCADAVTEPKEPTGQMATEENLADYEEAKARFDEIQENAGHTYEPVDAAWADDSSSISFSILECTADCLDRKPYVDCLLESDIRIEFEEAQTAETGVEIVGNCTEGVTRTTKVEGTIQISENETVKFTLKGETEEFPAGEHVWDEGVVEVEPTEEESGVLKYTCEICEATKDEVLPPKDHEHEYEEVVTAPNCEDAGYTTYTCKCGVSEIKDHVPALGHTEVIDEAVAATCTEKGKTEGKHCSVCEEVLVEQEEVDALGHTWDEGTVTKEPTEEETGISLHTCTVCQETEERTIPTKEHGHKYETVVTAPTCTDTGYTTHTCTCGETYVDNIVEALGHTEVVDAAVAATCTEKGKTEGKHCSVCNTILVAQTDIDALGHTEVIDAAVAATCTTAGKTEGKHCSVCEVILVTQSDIAPLGHVETIDPAVAATCTTAGKTEGKYCSVCETTLVASTQIPALGHTEVVDAAVAATCTTAGKTEGKHCSVCNETLVAQTEIAALGHSWDEGTVTKEPTEEETGIKTFTCETCKETKTEVIPTLDHVHKHETVVTAPTCTDGGYTTYSCACGDTYVAEHVAALGHTEVIDAAVAATCTEKGKTEGKHCSVCNETLVAQTEIAALGHTEVIDPAVAADCTTAGKTEGKHCSVCNEVLVAQTDVAALGHSWDEGTVTKEPTEEETGIKTFTCETCKETKTEVIPTLNHEHKYEAVVTAPTCTEGGYTTYTCTCGDTYTANEVAALGHTEVIDAAVAATCTEKGKTEGKHCDLCNEILVAQTEIAALGHVETIDPAVAATCTTAGKTEGKYCSVCQITLVPSEQIPALGHTWDEGVVTKEPTAKEPGIRTFTCTVCEETSEEEVEYVATAVQRISGKDRVKTALSVADALKDTLKVEKFDAVIIATGVNEKFADALAGSYLANMKKAPILLHNGGSNLSSLNVTYIQENLKENGTVYILGGDSAVPVTVEETLAAYNVVRLSGKTRYETNLEILKEAGISGADEILVATGNNFADSLSASAVGLPLLLVNGKNTSLNAVQTEFLKSVAGKKITIIGGDGAVSEEMKAAIEAITGVTAERISGKTRHNTSVLIAQKYFADADFALITYAKNFPDGLAGGPLAYALGAPLLLTNAGQEGIANEYITAGSIENGYVLGGDSAVSDGTAQKVFGLASDAVIAKAYYTK